MGTVLSSITTVTAVLMMAWLHEAKNDTVLQTFFEKLMERDANVETAIESLYQKNVKPSSLIA